MIATLFKMNILARPLSKYKRRSFEVSMMKNHADKSRLRGNSTLQALRSGNKVTQGNLDMALQAVNWNANNR